jgi:LuxR family maltose regulon positive regulatory protein
VEAAIRLLDRLRTSAEQGQRMGSVLEILVVLAVANDGRGDLPSATMSIKQALVLAEPEGYVRVFVEAGEAVAALLRTIPLDGPTRDHARRVLAAIGVGRSAALTAPYAPSTNRLVDDLSGRELDVLRLLRSDLAGPEIARELHVSLNTLRTHTKNIYTKLGVTNRREAIRRAAELGL